MTDTNSENLCITLKGKETVEIVNQLCIHTGMTPSCLIALLVRKYGTDLESWLGISPSTSHHPPTNKSTIELPTDPGKNLPPVEL